MYKRIIQKALLGLYLVIVLVNGLEEPSRIPKSIVFYGLLILVPIGATQLLGSAIDVVDKGKKSLFATHLRLTGVVLVLFVLALMLMNSALYELAEGILVAAFSGSLALMIYYWYIIFYGYKKGIGRTVNLRKETHGVESSE